MFRKLARSKAWTAFLAAALLMNLTAGLAFADPGISPNNVERLIFPGEKAVVAKSVTTPVIPPKPDIYFLADSTGSMAPALANVQSNATSILNDVASQTAEPRFGAGDYKDLPTDVYAFNNGASIPASDDGGAAALAAIGAWTAGGGVDGSEGQLYALDRIADGAVNWRSDSTRILVWFGDAPGHDPVCAALNGLGYDITEASVTAKLVAAKIRVIAISLDTGTYPAGLNDDPTASAYNYSPPCTIGGTAGQAARIASATGGVSLTNVSYEDVSQAILQGLENLPADVAMKSSCTAPISTSFAPASQIVTSGDVANFVETIAVASGAAAGTYNCYDWATINGEDMKDSAGHLITETKTIHVPGIDLQPATATNELGIDLSHEVTATVSAGSFGAVANTLVAFKITAGPNTGASGSGVTDASGQATFTYTPAVAPASLGTDSLQACYTNADGSVVYGCDTAAKTWRDTTPPTASCVPTTNPAGLNDPNAPGNGGQGQNQDGFYRVSATDLVWPASALRVLVTDSGSGAVFGPFPTGTKIKYVQAPGGKPGSRLMGDTGVHENYWQLTGKGDAVVTGLDGSGNVSAPVSCLVPPRPQ